MKAVGEFRGLILATTVGLKFLQVFIFAHPFTLRVSCGDTKVILTFESVDEILWCDPFK